MAADCHFVASGTVGELMAMVGASWEAASLLAMNHSFTATMALPLHHVM